MSRIGLFLAVNIAIVACSQNEVVVLRAVRGRDARLPCGQGKVFLDGPDSYVLWLRNDRDFMYRFPEEDFDRSFSGIFGTCESGACLDETSLLLKNIKNEDQGVYRCRVHYQASPSVDYFIDIRLVDAPATPKLFDGNGNKIESAYVGPLTLGSELILRCEVEDDQYETLVYWRRNGVVMERAQRVNSGLLRAVTKVKSLTRNDLDAHYECLASNGDVTEPSVTGVIIKMYLPPTKVAIQLDNNYYFEVGQPRVVDCIVVGCIPPPTITWHLGKDVLRPNVHREKHEGNFTLSSLNLVTSLKNDNNTLSCQVHTELKTVYETNITIRVGYRPLFQSATLLAKARRIINLTCTVESSPPPDRFIWTFQNNPEYFDEYMISQEYEEPFLYKSTLNEDMSIVLINDIRVTAVNHFGQQIKACTFNESNADTVTEYSDCEHGQAFPKLRLPCPRDCAIHEDAPHQFVVERVARCGEYDPTLLFVVSVCTHGHSVCTDNSQRLVEAKSYNYEKPSSMQSFHIENWMMFATVGLILLPVILIIIHKCKGFCLACLRRGDNHRNDFSNGESPDITICHKPRHEVPLSISTISIEPGSVEEIPMNVLRRPPLGATSFYV